MLEWALPFSSLYRRHLPPPRPRRGRTALLCGISSWGLRKVSRWCILGGGCGLGVGGRRIVGWEERFEVSFYTFVVLEICSRDISKPYSVLAILAWKTYPIENVCPPCS